MSEHLSYRWMAVATYSIQIWPIGRRRTDLVFVTNHRSASEGSCLLSVLCHHENTRGFLLPRLYGIVSAILYLASSLKTQPSSQITGYSSLPRCEYEGIYIRQYRSEFNLTLRLTLTKRLMRAGCCEGRPTPRPRFRSCGRRKVLDPARSAIFSHGNN